MSGSPRQRAEGTGCGKVILVGEHFVLDGATAVALSLPGFQTRVRLEADPGVAAGQAVLQDGNPALNADEIGRTESMLACALEAVPERRGVRATIDTTIPLRRGFGSSAAVAVAAVQAAFRLAGRPEPTPQAWLRAAREVECLVHGNSSGLDPAAAMGDGAVIFRDGQPRGWVKIDGGGTLAAARWVLLDLGPGPSTSEVIAAANRARRAMGEAATGALVARAEAAAQAAVAGLERGDAHAVALAMDEAGSCLDQIDVVDDRMRAIMADCRRAGAMSVKQTGAGRGGALLALAPDARIAETMRDQLAPHVHACWILETTT